MPSTYTITSTDFYSFTAGTRIRSAQVNSNFSVFRGHFLPVDLTASAAATTNTYDLGSPDHRWRNIYATPAPNVVSTTGSITVTSAMEVILMNTTAATTTVSLPTAVGFYGKLTIKNIGTAGKSAYLDGSGSQTIDNTLTVNLVDYESVTLVSDQSNWWSI